ncbi:MAG: glycosyltransferase [Bdellovibrionales bacterium]
MKTVDIIIPFYNNSANIPHTLPAFYSLAQNLEKEYAIHFYFVNDASTDNTLEKLVKEAIRTNVTVLDLSRNFGPSGAVLAGLEESSSDAQLFTAADLQTPIETIERMIRSISDSSKVVLAQRIGRKEPILGRLFSKTYHKILKSALPNAPAGGFDSAIMLKQVSQSLIKNASPSEYLPSLILWMGFPTITIPYERQKREHGKSQWNFTRKITAALDSFLGYTYGPIRVMSLIGLLFGFLGLCYSSLIVINYFQNDSSVSGWSSLMIVLLLSSSFNFLFLGLIGEYVWRGLIASQKRATYIVNEIYSGDEN